MQESVILLILILICIGQVWAISRGRLTAAIYYISIAPLGYFTVWMYGSWGAERLCGLLLIAGGLLKFKRILGVPRFIDHPLIILLAYLISITLIGQFFWPIGAMAGKSSVYGSLRGVIQIIDWLILAGAAWQVAIALSLPGAMGARKTIILVGILYCAYAIYQVIAYWTDLPSTGIRRVYEGVAANSEGEQFAGFHVGGIFLYRPGSLIGEPKGLGVISLVWISSILTFFMHGKVSLRLKMGLFIITSTLFLTFSTSAWAGFIGMIIIFLWTIRKQLKNRLVRLSMPMLALILGLAMADSSFFSQDNLSVSAMIKERTVMREYLADLSEIEAKRVLEDHPELFLSGTGLGGMSFFIAENLGGSDIILFPNTGLLAYVCNMGFIGISLLIFALWRGLRLTLIGFPHIDAGTRSLSFIGTVCLMQTFIFDAGISLFALAFLLAADFRWRRVYAGHLSHFFFNRSKQQLGVVTDRANGATDDRVNGASKTW